MNINLYSDVVFSDISSSSSDLSSSSDDFFWDPVLYPSYIYPIDPVLQSVPLTQEPVKSDTIDLKELFKIYNETMSIMSADLKAMEKIYKLLNSIGDHISDEEFDSVDETRANLVPRIKSSVGSFKPVVLENYTFKMNDETKDMIATMNDNVIKYNKAYNEIIGANKKFKEYSDLYTKLMDEFEKSP